MKRLVLGWGEVGRKLKTTFRHKIHEKQMIYIPTNNLKASDCMTAFTMTLFSGIIHHKFIVSIKKQLARESEKLCFHSAQSIKKTKET